MKRYWFVVAAAALLLHAAQSSEACIECRKNLGGACGTIVVRICECSTCYSGKTVCISGAACNPPEWCTDVDNTDDTSILFGCNQNCTVEVSPGQGFSWGDVNSCIRMSVISL